MAAKSRPQLARSPRSVVSVSSNNTTQKQQPASLAKRLLFPQLPPGSNLPPLFASLLCPPELNEEAYDFLALALRAFVNTWWSKITRYDKELLPEITSIITLVVRRLEARLLAVDLSQVVFSDIPALLTQHYIDYRHASAKVSTSYAAGGAASLPQLFHQLQPHMALSSDGRINEEYFRQAFDLVLKACLSPEDYAPDPERFIIREIILKVLLRDVIPKITQPWFIQRTLLDLLGPTQDVEPEKSSEFTVPIPPTSFSFHTVIVFFLSAIQSISGTCLALIHAYKQMVNTIKLVNQSAPPRPPAQTQPSSHPTQAPSPPRPIHLSIRTNSGRSTSPLSSSYASAASSTSSLHPHPASHQPSSTVDHSPNDYARQLFSLVSEIFTMQDRFASSTILHTINVMFAFSSAFVNRLLTHMLYTHALSPPSMLTVLRLSKRTLFPNGYPGPPPADPSPEEQFIIRQQLTKRIRECMPSIAMSLALGPSPSATLDAAIDPLSDAACNSHLIVLIIDALLLTIFPEMGVEGTAGTNKGDVTREDWVPEDISRTSSANS